MDTNKLERVKQLVMKQLTGTLTGPEQEELRRLTDSDADCRRLADELLASDFLTAAVLDENTAWQERTWQGLYRRMGVRGGVLSRLYRRRYRLAAAAAILILVFGAWAGWYLRTGEESPIGPGTTLAEISWPDGQKSVRTDDLLSGTFASADLTGAPSGDNELSPDLYTRVVVPQGSEYKVRLDDGTDIHLDAESSLAVPTGFSAHNRHINLSGEAYLEVSKDSLHPFTIHTEKADLLVRGTKLNIRCREDEPCLEVVLESGRLDVRSPREEVSLPVGHKAVVDAAGGIRILPADVYAATAWHHGRFVFDNRPLDYIMREMERWYDVHASFSSDKVRQMRFTLDLDRYDTFNRFVEVVSLIGEADITLKKNQVLISEKRHTLKH